MRGQQRWGRAERTGVDATELRGRGVGVASEDEAWEEEAERVLELNTEHPAFQALSDAVANDPEKAKAYAQVLYNQACLIAGLPIENPSAYTDLICSLWK